MQDNLFSLILANQQKQQLQKVLDCNPYTQKFGVRLSNEDALILLQSSKDVLKEQERLELNDGILPKIIFSFCDSPYIYQDNYVETLEALQNIFYLYKNESLDELTDDELLSYMKEHFDGDCQGSLEYLEETCLEDFCREIRKSSKGFIGSMNDEE